MRTLACLITVQCLCMLYPEHSSFTPKTRNIHISKTLNAYKLYLLHLHACTENISIQSPAERMVSLSESHSSAPLCGLRQNLMSMYTWIVCLATDHRRPSPSTQSHVSLKFCICAINYVFNHWSEEKIQLKPNCSIFLWCSESKSGDVLATTLYALYIHYTLLYHSVVEFSDLKVWNHFLEQHDSDSSAGCNCIQTTGLLLMCLF